MKHRKRTADWDVRVAGGIFLALAILIVSFLPSALADWNGDDQTNPDNIPWDPNFQAVFYFVDPDGIVQYAMISAWYAVSNLRTDHVRADCGHALNHHHFQIDFNDYVSPAWLDETCFDKYWDYRFGVPTKCTRVSGTHASNTQNCFTWAFDNYSDTGDYVPVYKYWIDYNTAAGDPNYNVIHAFANDRAYFRNPALDEVQPGDFIHYDDPISFSHVSVVESIRSNGAGGNEPNVLIWKTNASGIYKYTTPNGFEYRTPFCDGPTSGPNKTLSEQGWTWDPNWQDKMPYIWPDD